MGRRNQDFQTIRSEGGLLPTDLLRRVLDPKERLDGTRPEDYGLPQGERLNEVITQSWNRLRKHWAEFRAAADHMPQTEAGTGLTNDKWSLPLLRELGFGPLPTSAGPEVDGRSYAISRFVGPVPVHLVGCGLSLDRRAAGQRGAAAVNPHGLVQEFLNRSAGHLWAIVSNGLRMRLLRDNQALSRQSFLEFDLEAMFAGEAYSDFVLLWLTAHATRFAPRGGDRPESCWLEQWTKEAEEQGTRALGDLRGGVERALQILGEGFTSHPKNTALRDALRTGQVPLGDFHGQLLRIVYRLIFLFVAEDRTLDGKPLLHPRDGSDGARDARERFAAHYGTARLRELAAKIKGSRHGDLWRQFRLLVGALSGDAAFSAAREHLALPTLGSFLWSLDSTATLNDAELTNHDLLEALRHLAFTRQGKALRPVDYRNLGAEELGGVYESLLALTPQISADGARFTFAEFAGNERKTSGSYYTPDSLVQCLLDSALDPVVEQALKGKSGAAAEQAILSLKVCDPAVGSGHFLVGAAHRLARHLARVRALAQGESEPSPLLYQHALRDVIGRCLYGVDVNPMAAELCRVSLWLEALEPGKPLSFLDHHIRVGNSLLGATPGLIAAGLPDKAFTAIEGDDQRACTVLRTRNRAERRGLGPLFSEQEAETQARLQQAAAALEELPEDRPEDVLAKELAFRRHEQTAEFRHKKQLADAWCAAFVIKKCFREPGHEASASGIRQDHLHQLAAGRHLAADLAAEVERLSDEYQVFHWHLAFPEVFAKGGFDCVLGNPPWERVNLKEQEWFAERRPDIASAPNSVGRKHLIERLRTQEPSLHGQFTDALRRADAEGHFIRNSGLYPLCGRGDINLYAIFAENMRDRVRPYGRAGCVLPSGIATDDTTKFFFQDVVEKQSLVSLFDFENKGMFPTVHSSYKFCLFTSGGRSEPLTDAAEFVFFAHDVEDLRNSDRRFTLRAEEIAALNPNSHTCPIFRGARDAELTKTIYRHTTILVNENRAESGNPWSIEIGRMFHTSDDSPLFSAEPGPSTIRLYEAKCYWQFDHRYATLTGNDYHDVNQEQKRDPCFSIRVRYNIERSDIPGKFKHRLSLWFLSFRKISRATDARTLIVSITPESGLLDSGNNIYIKSAINAVCLLGSLNSFPVDYVSRQKIGGPNMTVGVISQLPSIPPAKYGDRCEWSFGRQTLREWILPRVLELTYTAWDLEPFAQGCGCSVPPFCWDEDRRFLLRRELDAAFFHLYLPTEANGEWSRADGETAEDLVRLKASFPTPREAVAYIMDTFPIVRRKDEEMFDGDYRTKRVILEIYDALAQSMRTGQPYETRLNPPPADPSVAHLSRLFVGPEALDEFKRLPDGAWAPSPAVDWTDAVLPILAAVLKSQGAPTSTRDVRLASALALEPRLLTPCLDEAFAAEWRRLIGQDAAPLPSGVHAFAPHANTAWGAAVTQLRGTGRLMEDAGKDTWAAGPGLESIDTTTWPDGRARFVWRAIRHRGVDTVVTKLPEAVQAWVNEEAA